MSIVSLQDCLNFLNIKSKAAFEITAANDELVFTSDQGSSTIDVPDGTYEADELASALQTAMNADSTLTGGVITFAVSYSSSTSKFTIDAGTGHTIAYTHTGSDAGLTFGFSEDASAAQSITSDTAVSGDPTSIVSTIHDGVEQWVETYCDRVFSETSYTNKLFDGTGTNWLSLSDYPVTAVSRVANVREEAIKIKNTATDATNDYVSVQYSSNAPSSLELVVVGGASESSASLSFSTYTTLSALVTAINALGNGWSAEITDDDYNDYKTTNLLETYNLFCGSWRGAESSWEYLDMADEPISVKLYSERGELYSGAGFPLGHRNIAVSYTVGYTSSTMPSDLKFAVLTAVQALYNKRNEDGFGISSQSLGGLSVKYAQWLPEET